MILRYYIDYDTNIKTYLEKLKFPKTLQSDLGKKTGSLLVNNQIVHNYYQLKKGDLLEIIIPSTENKKVKPIKESFDIIYEDSYLLIINKRADLATLPTNEHYNCSLANHIMAYYKEKGIASTIHFVNRLDAPTTGLLIVAKNSYVKYLMTKTTITKKYLLMVEKRVISDKGTIETGIKRVDDNIILRQTSDDGPHAKTTYEILKRFDNKTLIEATLHTGKTHQIRVHFQSIGYPLIGDILYGNGKKGERLLLHSSFISFFHPITKEEMRFVNYPDWLLPHYLPS